MDLTFNKLVNASFVVARLPLIRSSQATELCLETTEEVLEEHSILELDPGSEDCPSFLKKIFAIINTQNQLNPSCVQVPWEEHFCDESSSSSESSSSES